MSSSFLSINCRLVGDELSRRVAERCGSGAQSPRLSAVASAFLVRLFLMQAKAAVGRRRERGAQGWDEDDGEDGEVGYEDRSITLLPPPSSAQLSVADVTSLGWTDAPLVPKDVDAVAECLLPTALSADHPLLCTVLMQVEFEASYALSEHQSRARDAEAAAAQSARVEDVVVSGVSGDDQVAMRGFYAALFALAMHGAGMTAEARADRRVQREVAAALESVFPASHLLDHARRGEDERRSELRELPELVLGIRLFNRQLRKGGEGLSLSAASAQQLNGGLQAELEHEAAFIGEIAQSYTEVVQHWTGPGPGTGGRQGEEEEKRSLSAAPAPPSSSLRRAYAELIHRRQYLLFVHSLQADCTSASAALLELARSMEALYAQLTAIVGLRSSVSKAAVFPVFRAVGAAYRALLDEDRRMQQRRDLFEQLKHSRNPFVTSLQPSAIRQAKERQSGAAAAAPGQPSDSADAGFDFVLTATRDDDDDEGAASAATPSAGRCVRVTSSSSRRFMSLPLSFQGYCCVTLVQSGGFLLAGDPSLGLIRYQGQHFAFASMAAMRAFVRSPDEVVAALERRTAAAFPGLVHLLGLQRRLPVTDIAHFLSQALLQQARAQPQSFSLLPPPPPSKRAASTQTPVHFPVEEHGSSAASPMSAVHWNEWEMRRRALHMADLSSKRTHATQTHLSHFRRHNDAQYGLAQRSDEGAAQGVGTQTRVDAATNSERSVQLLAGLKRPSDHGDARVAAVTFRMPPIVQQPSNPDLRA